MMPASIKHSLKRGLSSAAVWPAVSWFFRPAAIVLAYHRIGPPDAPFRKVTIDNFRAQVAWLQRHCRVLHPNELRQAVAEPPKRLPVLITFDDGYRDYYEHAVPVLREFSVPAVNFVATQFVDEGTLFWWDQVDMACQRSRAAGITLPWGEGPFATATAADRMRIYRACQRHLKAVSEAEKQALLPKVFGALAVDPRELALERQVMTWDQMRATRDVTTYGGHLHSHPLVSRIDDAALETELRRSHERMEAELGSRPTLFAYPDGDITPAAQAILQRHGYDMAFGILEGIVSSRSNWFAIDRLTGPATVADLAWRIARLQRAPQGRGRTALPYDRT